jgi:hypothetical protein
LSRVEATKKQNLPLPGEISRIQTKKAINLSNGQIISQSSICNQVPTKFLSSFSHHSKLAFLVQQKHSTESLEHLEKLGCTGDAALSVLANLQLFGGVA